MDKGKNTKRIKEIATHLNEIEKLNKKILCGYGELKPLMLEVLSRRSRNPLEDYPTFKGRKDITSKELKTILEKERKFADKVSSKQEEYLLSSWRPMVQAYVSLALVLEEIIADKADELGEIKRLID